MDSVLRFIPDFESRVEEVIIAHLICDSQGKIVDWILEDANPAALGMLKKPSFKGHKGRLGSDIVGRENISLILTELNKAKGQGKQVVYEHSSPFRDMAQVVIFTIVGDEVIIVKKSYTKENQAGAIQSKG